MFELNTHERIIKNKVDLNRNFPFFAYILMNMNIEKTEATDKIPTMAVNAYGDLYWNEDFAAKLSDNELKFVLCHETMHMSTLTFQRQGLRDATLWNIATDLVINYMLIQENLTAPKDILVPDYKGIYTFPSGKKDGKTIYIDLNEKVAEQVYDEIQKNAKTVKQRLNADGEGNYDGQVGKHIPDDKDDKGKSQGKGNTEADKKANEQKWKQKSVEAATKAKMAGKLSAGMERMIDKILVPVVDWRNRLFAYITNELPVDYSMRMPSRRCIATGVYTPTIIKESLEVMVGVDISGSISNEEYTEFISEVIGIAESYRQVKLRVIAWAHEVDPRDDILVTQDTKDQLMKNKWAGGGGTTFDCYGEYCRKKGYKSRIHVILTDGYVNSNPKPPDDGDVLFVISKNGSSEELNKLGECLSLNDRHRNN